jgi:hypothetical protein
MWTTISSNLVGPSLGKILPPHLRNQTSFWGRIIKPEIRFNKGHLFEIPSILDPHPNVYPLFDNMVRFEWQEESKLEMISPNTYLTTSIWNLSHHHMSLYIYIYIYKSTIVVDVHIFINDIGQSLQ